MTHNLGTPTMATLFAAGLIFLLALVLGIWKYRQMATSPDHLAHPYVDIAHRAALLYSFATLLLAVFVELSAWPSWVNSAAAATVIVFFVGAIVVPGEGICDRVLAAPKPLAILSDPM